MCKVLLFFIVAAAAFKEFGEQLKRLRQHDDYDIVCSYLENEEDPANNDPNLEEKLKINYELGNKRLQKVIFYTEMNIQC